MDEDLRELRALPEFDRETVQAVHTKLENTRAALAILFAIYTERWPPTVVMHRPPG